MYCLAYLRVSTEEQTTKPQLEKIIEYANEHNFTISEIIDLKISSRSLPVDRRLTELDKLKANDILVAVEITRLARNLSELVVLVNNLINKGVRVILINNKIDFRKDLTIKNNSGDFMKDKFLEFQLFMFSMMADFEREFVRVRTTDGIASAKLQGRIGGRRKGTLYHTKYDKHLPKIKECLELGYSLATILKTIKEGKTKSLSNYLEKRG